MSHVDLFSGIGGFALAASWCGIDTVQFVEIDERCRAFLAKRWPGVPIHDDIRTFDGTQHRGAFLLTGGVPCQPASRAGKQKGASDDRWLWPEAIRVLGEVNPAWALFENPPGIGDVGLAGILAQMEGVGYQVRVFGVPACAVGAPHRRERYWIVGHTHECGKGELANTTGTRRDGATRQEQHDERRPLLPARLGDGRNCLADACGTERRTGNDRPNEPRGSQPELARGSFWDNAVWLPCADGKLRRAPDNSFGVAHGLHRSILAGLGNSIVPQVACQIIKAMILTDREGEK